MVSWNQINQDKIKVLSFSQCFKMFTSFPTCVFSVLLLPAAENLAKCFQQSQKLSGVS